MFDHNEINTVNNFIKDNKFKSHMECQKFYETLTDNGKDYFNREAHKNVILYYKRKKIDDI